MRSLLQDFRFGLRQWRRAPGFALVAIVTLALGIGANVTIFSATSALLLAQPPLHDAGRVVIVCGSNTRGWTTAPLTGQDWARLRGARAFSATAAATFSQSVNWLPEPGAVPHSVAARQVSASFFPTLGVTPVLGRNFPAAEAQPGGAHVALVSHAFWASQLHASPAVLGRTLLLNAGRYTIVGVLPARYFSVSFPAQIWTPLIVPPASLAPGPKAQRWLYVYGRLRPGVTLAAAQAEVQAIGDGIAKRDTAQKDWKLDAVTARQFRRRSANADTAISLLLGMVGFVLLIACANVASLLLARSEARRQEMALRAALGAGRGRVIRQLLAESVLLGAAGGALALVFGWVGIRLLQTGLTWNSFVRAMRLPIDGPVLLLTAGATVVAVVLFGMMPAWQMAHADPQAALKTAAAGAIGAGRGGLRRLLVGLEVALAVLLLVGMGLMVQATIVQFARPYGFPAQNATTLSVTLPKSAFAVPAGRALYFSQVAARVRALPGITGAGWTDNPPLDNYNSVTFSPGDRLRKTVRAFLFTTSPGYLPALGAPVLAGRNFRSTDNATAPRVALVNQTLAGHYFPAASPIGRFITVHLNSGLRNCRIVGVVGGVEDYVGQRHMHPQIYLPMAQAAGLSREMTLVVRAHPGAMPKPGALAQAIWSGAAGRSLQIGELTTFPALANANNGAPFLSQLMAVFAALALVLAAVGLYGVVAYWTSRRTREFALRLALGASRGQIGGLVARDTLRASAIGLAAGVVLAVAFLPRLLTAMFGYMEVTVVPIAAAVAVLIAIVAAIAALAPARRAMRADPAAALRYE
ncbi:MAG: ADOP family duplicated permease [Terriglobales bacterium]